MSRLERRYRRPLRVLPEWYRRGREEEMTAIFLAGRTDELGRPGRGETGAVLTGVPGKVLWRGEIVRVLGMLGIFCAGASIANQVVQSGAEHSGSAVTWLRVFDLAPVVAFPALLGGERTPATRVAAAVAAVPGVWAAFQVPSLIRFVAPCPGFHRDAPTPPMRRSLWWGGGAAAGGGLPAIVLIVVVLLFAPIAFVLAGEGLVVGGLVVPAVVLALLLALSTVLPVRRAVRA